MQEREQVGLELTKNLLDVQLKDLDDVISRAARTRGFEPEDVPPVLTADPADVSAPGIESLLRAQLREVENWLAEVRRREVVDDAPTRPTVAEEKLALALPQSRLRVAAFAGGRLPEASRRILHAQRLETAREALTYARDAHTQRSLALQQAHGARQQSEEDLGRLCSQLRFLHADSEGARPELARYFATDVAMAFVGAIERRRAAFHVLTDAVVTARRFRAAVAAHERLLAGLRATSLPPPPQGGPPEDMMAMVSPAARIHFSGAAEGLAEAPEQAALRLRGLAERNFELWLRMSAYLRPTSGPRPHGGDASRCGTVALGANALAHELQALRAKEGRLDELLAGEGPMLPAPRGAPPRMGCRATLGACAQICGPLGVGPCSRPVLDNSELMGDVLKEWRFAVVREKFWVTSRRERAVREFVGKAGPCLALWGFASMVVAHRERALPFRQLVRGARVKEIATSQVGTVLSMTPQGVVKVSFAGGEYTRLVKAGSLVWLQEGLHPIVAGICFHSWRWAMMCTRKTILGRFRAKILASRRGTSNYRLIGWLAVGASDMGLLTQLCFGGWRQCTRSSVDKVKSFLLEAFLTWREGVLFSRHSRTVQDLEVASSELHFARLALLRQTQRFERLERRLVEMQDMHDSLYAGAVLAAWRTVTQASNVKREIARAGRDERSVVTDLVTQMMLRSNLVHLLGGYVRAWRAFIKLRRTGLFNFKARQRAQDMVSLALVFSNWRSIPKYRDRDKMQVAQSRADMLRNELNNMMELAQEMFHFAHQSAPRVHQLEQALRAADRAVQLGQSHNQVLSRQVRALEEQLSQQGGSGAYPGQDPEIQRLRDELLIAQWEAGQAQQPRYGAEEDAAAARIQAAYRDAQRRRQQELDSERFRAYR